MNTTARIVSLTGRVQTVGGGQAPPETDPEKTLPLPPITPMVLLRHAVLMRAADWWRGGLITKALLVMALVVLLAVLLRDHGRASGNVAPTGTLGSAASSTPVSTENSPPGTGAGAAVAAQEDPHAIAPRSLSTAERGALPRATVGAALDHVPTDPAPTTDPGRTTLHPTSDLAVYAEPGGAPVAVLPPLQMLAPTWVPVVDRRPGWALVLLPSRPHPGGAAAAGWVYLTPSVRLVDTDRRVELDTATGTVTVLAELGRADTRVASTLRAVPRSFGNRSFVAIGAAQHGTPQSGGLWFLRAIWPFAPSTQRLCTGPVGGIAVPGLPTESPLGQLDVSGCVATPPALREALAQIPTGTPVLLR
ncbi:hypothetical protein FKR81_37470 [Lentzea tibetensis]|uniref:L,D-transpeptidase catalytic domain n=1 Tax=Lentzea tibetensis TaxID=2591470 RepID=A0A563EIB8_9PSEU|nr:hypothetical protein [Lentzea tibetensis]TWP46060.1 hypothetical protein FKR81_37470 [Lentzea tibetensis]